MTIIPPKAITKNHTVIAFGGIIGIGIVDFLGGYIIETLCSEKIPELWSAIPFGNRHSLTSVSYTHLLHPVRLNIRRAVTLLQKDNVADNIRASISLERIVGQSNSPQQIGAFCHVFAGSAVLAVHGVAAGDERHYAARTHLVDGPTMRSRLMLARMLRCV